MTDLLIVLAVLAGVAGLASLSQATTGVGVICGGCLLAIFGRIAQATQQLAVMNTTEQAMARSVIEAMDLPADRRSRLLEVLKGR